MADKIMLVDGNSLINRGFYAMPLLTNKDGEYTNGVFGFLNIFFRLFDEIQPEYCAVCFDVHQPTFRHKMFGEYKGTRKGMPEELRPQMPLLKKVLQAMNITTCELGGYEADDLLGTLATRADAIGLAPIIVSGDRDLLQIASDTITIKIPKTKGGSTTIESYNTADVVSAYGVTPKEFIEVKALMGDTSDNVPGVPYIGEKTASKIIQQYKTVENAIENASEVKPKRASENLVTYKEQALLSKTLVTIKTDVPYEVAIDELKVHDMYNENAYGLFKQYEFKTMLKRFDTTAVAQQNSGDFKLVTTVPEAEDVLTNLNPFEPCAFKLFIENGSITAFSVTDTPQKAYVIKLPNIEAVIKSFLESDSSKITHDVKEIVVYLKKFGIEVKGITFDSMLAGYILNSSRDNYDYCEIGEDFLGESYPTDEEILGKGKSRKAIADLDAEQLTQFCGQYSDILLRAYKPMCQQLEENGQKELYYNIELPLAYVLADMEDAGMAVNREALTEYKEKLEKKLDTLTKDIYWLAGEEFNINSPKQLSHILFEKLGLKGGKKTKTGWSTSADILEKLKDEDEIVRKVLEYRTYSKLKSTYADGLLAVISDDGKIHSTFNQTITTTGRISSTEPNLQNIPVKIELGRELRKVFIPQKDCVYVDADYSQIELRVMAAMSGDEVLINAFKENQDIHRLTASQVFGVPFDDVTPLQRSNAKAVNFGIIYGIGSYSLSQDIGITKKEADKYIAGYFAKYPKVKEFVDNCVETARETGYATTIFNRRRYIPEITANNFMQRSFGERVAMNMPVQGSAADIIKIAMVKVWERLKALGLKSRLVLQVHDELLIETYKDEQEQVERLLQEEMENAVKLSVPLIAEVHSGNNWYEVK